MTPKTQPSRITTHVRALVLLAGMGWLAGMVGCASKPVPPPPPMAWQEAGRLSRQAALLQANGDWTGSVVWWERAARQYQLLNDRTNLAMAWHNLGSVRRALGRTDDATADLERAAELNAVLGQTNAWWRNQIALLQVENDAGKPTASDRLARLDLRPDRPIHGKLGAVLAQERARSWMTAGRLPEALRDAQQAVSEFEAVGDRAGAAAANVTVGKILRRMERYSEAAQIWRKVLGEFEALGDPGGVAVALAGWGGSLAGDVREREAALDLLRRAEENYRRMGLDREAEAVAAERRALATPKGP